MLRSLGLAASKLLTPQAEAIAEVAAALAEGPWRGEALELLAGGWRDQVTAAAAIAIDGATGASGANAASGHSLDTAPLFAALWTAIDGASWVAPQLVAAALIADPDFEPHVSDWLAAPLRRPPKTIGAIVRAYNRCPARRMPVLAQLGVHDRTLATEEARIGVRGVDGWLDYFAGSSRAS